jgi:hypothetical protein
MVLLEIIKNMGIDIFDPNAPILVKLSLCLLLLTLISLSCILNIFMYFIIRLSIDSKYVKELKDK